MCTVPNVLAVVMGLALGAFTGDIGVP